MRQFIDDAVAAFVERHGEAPQFLVVSQDFAGDMAAETAPLSDVPAALPLVDRYRTSDGCALILVIPGDNAVTLLGLDENRRSGTLLLTQAHQLPDRPGWWCWAPAPGAAPVPVWLLDAGDLSEERGPLGWLVCGIAPYPNSYVGLLPYPTSRTVRTMGGVWLGPLQLPRLPIPCDRCDKPMMLYQTDNPGKVIARWCPECWKKHVDNNFRQKTQPRRRRSTPSKRSDPCPSTRPMASAARTAGATPGRTV